MTTTRTSKSWWWAMLVFAIVAMSAGCGGGGNKASTTPGAASGSTASASSGSSCTEALPFCDRDKVCASLNSAMADQLSLPVIPNPYGSVGLDDVKMSGIVKGFYDFKDDPMVKPEICSISYGTKAGSPPEINITFIEPVGADTGFEDDLFAAYGFGDTSDQTVALDGLGQRANYVLGVSKGPFAEVHVLIDTDYAMKVEIFEGEGASPDLSTMEGAKRVALAALAGLGAAPSASIAPIDVPDVGGHDFCGVLRSTLDGLTELFKNTNALSSDGLAAINSFASDAADKLDAAAPDEIKADVVQLTASLRRGISLDDSSSTSSEELAAEKRVDDYSLRVCGFKASIEGSGSDSN